MKQPHRMPKAPLQDFMADVVRELEERGELQNLPGKGQPQRIDDTEMTNAKALANRVLKNGKFPPPWTTLGDEIERDIQRAEQDILRAYRYRQDALHRPRRAAQEAVIERDWRGAQDLLQTRVAEVNRKILKFNLTIPPQLPHLHKRRLQVAETLQRLGIVIVEPEK